MTNANNMRVPFEHLCPEVQEAMHDLKVAMAIHEPDWMHAQVTFDNIRSELANPTVDVIKQ